MITMTELEAVISTAADGAQAQILTPEIDTIVWEEVSARTSGFTDARTTSHDTRSPGGSVAAPRSVVM